MISHRQACLSHFGARRNEHNDYALSGEHACNRRSWLPVSCFSKIWRAGWNLHHLYLVLHWLAQILCLILNEISSKKKKTCHMSTLALASSQLADLEYFQKYDTRSQDLQLQILPTVCWKSFIFSKSLQIFLCEGKDWAGWKCTFSEACTHFQAEIFIAILYCHGTISLILIAP